MLQNFFIDNVQNYNRNVWEKKQVSGLIIISCKLYQLYASYWAMIFGGTVWR